MSTGWNPQTDMPNLSGKVAVVTGGNSDIGRETARFLAAKGAKVYFTVRSEEKGWQTQRRIQEMSPEIDPAKLHWLKMDLTDLDSITATADRLKREEEKVDILINNAAASTWSTEPVGGGWEIHMAVNLIGPFVFTNRLMPLLKSAALDNSADVRIVTLSSSSQVAMLPRRFKFPFESPGFLSNPVPEYPWKSRYFVKYFFGFDMVRYSVSKAANFIFAQELQRQLDEQGSPILSLAVHPGEVATEGLFAINNVVVRTIARLSFLSPEQGAANPVFAAVAREIRESPGHFKGKLLTPVGKIGEASHAASDESQVKGLWQNMMLQVNKQLVKDRLPGLQPW
ncbi:daunorubicin c-13 ketoreductase [Colletotrichum truncatum]|uniref:Daunorubicin c-13 ketoreductase n=1 Tax=Colletotrichum truncatum TaxID=5467 RepID=A0ACC3YPE3_COLTU|nr:daunorubicin c-13 ketoreductase [Colletotrichum truncatum]KAF6784263.1 daunorubicin c-13 ketoreductase [Colletotrichum truncatum]